MESSGRFIHLEPPDEALCARVAERDDVEEAAFAKVYSQRALDTLGRLPPDQRRVLVMSYFVGLSHSAIAEELSLPLGTVKKRARLGMQKLRQALITDETSEEPIQHKEVRPDERR